MAYKFSALQHAQTPDFVGKMVKWVVILFFVFPLLMLLLPWQQNITAAGSVMAYSPSERVQQVDAPVSGLVTKRYVQEGSHVKKGDVLLEISDTDPKFRQRIAQQRDEQKNKLLAKDEELKAYQSQLLNLNTLRDAKISAAQFKLDMAKQKVAAANETYASAMAALDAATLQNERLARLLNEGLISKRDVELAERDFIIATRNVNTARAQQMSAQAEVKTASADIQQARADAGASINSANAVVNKIQSEIADAKNSLTSFEISLSRQSAQQVIAPRDGMVMRVMVNTESEIVSQGQHLLTIVPETAQRAVALLVDGRDAALMHTGSPVRIEFEGWPAIQFSGWPSVAIGTFGGKVAFVDTSDDGTGNFRVMVLPDETQQKWPTAKFLRQGVSTKAWVLLEEVSIGYEIWRVLNGLPPRLSESALNAEIQATVKAK